MRVPVGLRSDSKRIAGPSKPTFKSSTTKKELISVRKKTKSKKVEAAKKVVNEVAPVTRLAKRGYGDDQGPSKKQKATVEEPSSGTSKRGHIEDRKRRKKEKAIKESAASFAEKVSGKVNGPNLEPVIRKVFIPEYKHVDLDRNPREEEPFMRTQKQRTGPAPSEAKSVPGKPAKRTAVQAKKKTARDKIPVVKPKKKEKKGEHEVVAEYGLHQQPTSG